MNSLKVYNFLLNNHGVIIDIRTSLEHVIDGVVDIKNSYLYTCNVYDNESLEKFYHYVRSSFINIVLFIICKSGIRSKVLVDFLLSKKVRVVNVVDGVMGWIKNGLSNKKINFGEVYE